jgi:hypothetical protein
MAAWRVGRVSYDLRLSLNVMTRVLSSPMASPARLTYPFSE